MFDCGENVRTPHGIARVWPSPGKKPLENIVSRVLVSVQHQPAGFAMIRPFVERHRLEVATATTPLGRMLFIYEVEIFPIQLAFVDEHVNERREPPIVKDGSIQVLVPLLMLVHNHLSLRQIPDHNGSLNQFAAD